MKLPKSAIKKLEEKLSTATTYEDLMGKDGAIKDLLKTALETLLDAELESHLGYPKHSIKGNNSGNNRNGKTSKRLKTDSGELEIFVPRDRKSEFEPIIVPKNESRLGRFEDQIISMYSRGMSTREIKSHIEEIYGLQLSPTQVSMITERVLQDALEWQSRPLNQIYPIVFLDALFYKVRLNGKVQKRACYTVLGINLEGRKEILGLWIDGRRSKLLA